MGPLCFIQIYVSDVLIVLDVWDFATSSTVS